jgi:uncharacterized protein YukJ
MSAIWHIMKQNISNYHIPDCFFDPIEGKLYETDFGLFRVTKIRDDEMCEGILLSMNTFAIFNKKSLKKFKVEIFCNDCEKNSIISYHYFGLECPCGSFNTNL